MRLKIDLLAPEYLLVIPLFYDLCTLRGQNKKREQNITQDLIAQIVRSKPTVTEMQLIQNQASPSQNEAPVERPRKMTHPDPAVIFAIGGLFVLLVLISGAVTNTQKQSEKLPVQKQLTKKERQQLAEQKRLADIEANPIKVVSSTWSKGGFGSISVWNVTFLNRSKKPVGNIKYKTYYFSETKNLVAGGKDNLFSSATIQKIIQPGRKRTVRINDGFISSEANTAAFEVVGWEYIK